MEERGVSGRSYPDMFAPRVADHVEESVTLHGRFAHTLDLYFDQSGLAVDD